jgi:hypothetical protein
MEIIMKKYKKGLLLLGLTTTLGTATLSTAVEAKKCLENSEISTALMSDETDEYGRKSLSSLKLKTNLGNVRTNEPDELL